MVTAQKLNEITASLGLYQVAHRKGDKYFMFKCPGCDKRSRGYFPWNVDLHEETVVAICRHCLTVTRINFVIAGQSIQGGFRPNNP